MLPSYPYTMIYLRNFIFQTAFRVNFIVQLIYTRSFARTILILIITPRDFQWPKKLNWGPLHQVTVPWRVKTKTSGEVFTQQIPSKLLDHQLNIIFMETFSASLQKSHSEVALKRTLPSHPFCLITQISPFSPLCPIHYLTIASTHFLSSVYMIAQNK